MSSGHLYKHGAKAAQLRKFERRYGKKKGREVYGKVVGKVYREQHHGRSWNEGKTYHEHGYGHTEQHAYADGTMSSTHHSTPGPIGHLEDHLDGQQHALRMSPAVEIFMRDGVIAPFQREKGRGKKLASAFGL